MKRVIIIMSMLLLYSVSFVFIKVYAERSFIKDGEPSDSALVADADDENQDILAGVEEPYEEDPEVVELFTDFMPSETAPPEDYEPVLPESFSEPETDKISAGIAMRKLAAATSVPDFKDLITPSQPETKPEASPVSLPPETKKPETTAAPASTAADTSAATTASDESEAEDVNEADDEELSENMEYEEDEAKENIEDESETEITPEESVNIDDLPDNYYELSDAEMQALLAQFGVSSIDELLSQINGNSGDSSYAPSDDTSMENGGYTVGSSGSYADDVVTIYDYTYGNLRTENAFDLVCEIVNAEVGSTFEIEAIKAQAVTAYTYIKYHQAQGQYAELGTRANPSDKIKKAVAAVDGLAIYYNGSYAFTPFSASQGGYTASSKNVWGGDLPYLRSVANDFDYLDTTYYGKTATYTVEELRQKIESKTDIKLSENYQNWIQILSYNDNIYVGNIAIDGHTTAYVNGKECTLTGQLLRTSILNIHSTAFNISYGGGVFTFTTYGYGHGVGMSQIGANLYAKNGYTFDRILYHYYPGVSIY